MMTNERIFDAVEFAVRAHRGQVRKAGGGPFVVHPIAVGRILLDEGCPDVAVIAGFLHDTVEDTPVTLDEIDRTFGPDVASIVAGVTEPDKSLPWEDRKQQTLKKLQSAAQEVLMVHCADKLHNLWSLRTEIERDGPETAWGRFKRGREIQLWYYSGVLETIQLRLEGFRMLSLYREALHEAAQAG
ncbi:MAG TPA: bifunctional (p)ppGpp synthetase/guanosine-3',5'-bis(diphosphate) 3'-pyrophosphohydrolase [Planctomycetes bacterium]|nr:bifunctional (p)ppGpp synthetase/guanosine-3',5'-bis(diphosphate) 3'-pyrophosphohydrolase [Planctomycetota bacterium]